MITGVLPDSGAFIFSLPEVIYGYLPRTRSFWGALALGAQGSASITARMDDLGNVVSGAVLITGGVPAKAIPDGSLLVKGEVTAALVTPQIPFRVCFLFKLSDSHPNLSYKSVEGVWDAHFIVPGWTPANAVDIFRKPWGPAKAPLNSYVGQVKCFF